MDTRDSPEKQARDEVQAGQQALDRGAWSEGRALFLAALSHQRSPEALEGLAQSSIDQPAATTNELSEQAYRLYLEQGNQRAAARVAIGLGLQYGTRRGEAAVAGGWLQRARRLLEGLEPGPEHGWLAVWEAHLALLFHHDAETARRLLSEAEPLCRAPGVADLQVLWLGLQGMALVQEGNIGEGMRRLDEATTAAVAGELKDPQAAGNTCCYLLTACEEVKDYDRVAQWFERVRALFVRWGYTPGLTFCRDHYVAVLIWRGSWAEAEAEIEAMRQEASTIAPAFVAVGTWRLGELRRRQGRLDEAAALFAEAECDARSYLGRAALALDRSDPETAVAMVDRYLRRVGPDRRLKRAPAVELLVRAHAESGRPEEARGALDELRRLADDVGTTALRASLCAVAGVDATARGDHAASRRCLEDAVDLFTRAGAPFEAGRARIDLAACLRALGQHDAAACEARTAAELLGKLGARHEADRARAVLAGIVVPAPDTPERRAGGSCLSPREVEVLRLVAQGLGNAEIAERLFLSEHTVKRHVANILTKLHLPSRAGAAAAAVRLGIS